MLTARKAVILKVLVDEYITKGVPVASETVARGGLGVSSATIRNEMVALEEEGFLAQPHTSAGRIPTDKGYRHYVESLMDDVQLPLDQQLRIYHQFHQVETDIDEWTRLAASILSRLLRNAAIVTLPKHRESRLLHLELVYVQDLLALLIVILREARARQQMLMLDEPMSAEDLHATARRLNALLGGLLVSELPMLAVDLSPLERQVVTTVSQMMQAEQQEEYEEPYVDGLRHIMSQPEFTGMSKLAAVVELLEQRSLLRSILPRLVASEGVRVVIGSENEEEAMRECTMVVTRYGIPGEVSGAIGIVGPTRLEYRVAIPAVGFLSGVMSELVGEMYG